MTTTTGTHPTATALHKSRTGFPVIDPLEQLLAELAMQIRDNPPFTDDGLAADPAADTLDWADR